jgi:hypothetical protein
VELAKKDQALHLRKSNKVAAGVGYLQWETRISLNALLPCYSISKNHIHSGSYQSENYLVSDKNDLGCILLSRVGGI